MLRAFALALACVLPSAFTVAGGAIGPQSPGLSRPVRVYVLTEAGRGSAEERRIVETTEAIRKKLAGRKKWFLVRDAPGDADVVVKVLRVWSDVDEKTTHQGVHTTVRSDRPDDIGFIDVRETFHVEVEVRVGDEEPTTMTTTAQVDRAKDLSKRFASELQELLEARAR
jgi:hypothetical protein